MLIVRGLLTIGLGLLLAAPAGAEEAKVSLAKTRDGLKQLMDHLVDAEVTDTEVQQAGESNIHLILDSIALTELKLDEAVDKLGGSPRFKEYYDLIPRIEQAVREDLK